MKDNKMKTRNLYRNEDKIWTIVNLIKCHKGEIKWKYHLQTKS